MILMQERNLVVFKKNHKWAGCIGYIDEIKQNKLLIAVPQINKSVAYIYAQKEDITNVARYPEELIEEKS